MTFSAGFGSPMATHTSELAHILLTKRKIYTFLIHLSTKSILNLKTVMRFSGTLVCRRQCKIFASGVNFSIFTHFFVFLSKNC